MKKIILSLLALAVVVFVIILVNNFNKPKVAHEKALVIVQGKFAFCGASSAKATGNTITVEGKEFLGIDSNYFKYSTQDWFVPYLELNGKKSPEDIFITKFKKINGNEVGGEIG